MKKKLISGWHRRRGGWGRGLVQRPNGGWLLAAFFAAMLMGGCIAHWQIAAAGKAKGPVYTGLPSTGRMAEPLPLFTGSLDEQISLFLPHVTSSIPAAERSQPAESMPMETLPPAPEVDPPAPVTDPFAPLDFTEPAQQRLEPLRLVISPRAGAFNRGQTLELSFTPGWPCEYIDNRACLAQDAGGDWVLVSIHSGIGGEGEPLRRALEGMGFNQAAFPLAQVNSLLEGLPGSAVSLQQGEASLDLRIAAAARIPPGLLDQYYRLPVEEAFALAAQDNPALAEALSAGRPLLVLETCGWRHPDDPYVPGLTDTSASIYLLFLER